jgi:hypothetical protein
MFSRETKFAILAIFGILAVFMFHAASGPFSVVHGPATAFRALRSAVAIMLLMVAAALSNLRIFTTTSYLRPRCASWGQPKDPASVDHYAILLR